MNREERGEVDGDFKKNESPHFIAFSVFKTETVHMKHTFSSCTACLRLSSAALLCVSTAAVLFQQVRESLISYTRTPSLTVKANIQHKSRSSPKNVWNE